MSKLLIVELDTVKLTRVLQPRKEKRCTVTVRWSFLHIDPGRICKFRRPVERVGRKSAITVRGKPQERVNRGQSPRCLPAADRSVLTYIRDGLCSSTASSVAFLQVVL